MLVCRASCGRCVERGWGELICGWKDGSPFAVADLAGNVGDSLGRHPFYGAEKLGDYGGAFADDCEQVGRDFARQGEQGVGVFAEF